MTTTGSADTDSSEPQSWREAAVARSLNPARSRAEKRVQRFIDAAMELMDGTGGAAFTVQDVVERSGQSLRSFYQYFGGKHELMLALFEESVSSTAEHLRTQVADEEDALERLHRFVIAYYRLCRPSPARKSGKAGKGKARSGDKPPASSVLAEFAQQLLTAHPAEAARVFAPLVDLFDAILGEAVDAGQVRPDLDRRRVAGVVLESVMFHAFSATIAGAPLQADVDADAEELWDLLFRGLAA